MDKETLAGTGKGLEAIALYVDVERNGLSDFPLSDEVISQVEAANQLSTEEKIQLYDDKAAELRSLSGDIRDIASDDIVEVPGMGKYNFEFHGRKEPGKDGKDDEVSLSISRSIPRGSGPYTAWVALKRFSEGPARLIKNNSRVLNLKKRKKAPMSGHFVTLLDALETVQTMHGALGLNKKNKQN